MCSYVPTRACGRSARARDSPGWRARAIRRQMPHARWANPQIMKASLHGSRRKISPAGVAGRDGPRRDTPMPSLTHTSVCSRSSRNPRESGSQDIVWKWGLSARSGRKIWCRRQGATKQPLHPNSRALPGHEKTVIFRSSQEGGHHETAAEWGLLAWNLDDNRSRHGGTRLGSLRQKHEIQATNIYRRASRTSQESLFPEIPGTLADAYKSKSRKL